MEDNIVTKIEDAYVKEKPIWVATLNDGSKIYQDDDRPGLDEPVAWYRLNTYIHKHNLRIIRFRIQFCSNIVWTLDNQDGYYFSKGVGAFAFNPNGGNISIHNIGYYNKINNIVMVKSYVIPSHILIDVTKKKFEECGKMLIQNP